MENNPNNPFRNDEGEATNPEETLLRDVLVPAFTEATELIHSTVLFLRPTQEEWRHRSERIEIAQHMVEAINGALGRAAGPIDIPMLDSYYAAILERHQKIITSRETAIRRSAVFVNAVNIDRASGVATETALDYFEEHPESSLPEPIVRSGLRAQLTASNSMYGLEDYFRQELIKERTIIEESDDNKEHILQVIGRELASLARVKNKSPLRFMLRDVEIYKEQVVALNEKMSHLSENEDYAAIIAADKELRQVLRQLKFIRG